MDRHLLATEQRREESRLQFLGAPFDDGRPGHHHPDAARPALEQTYVAPRTPLEQELARIWAELLRLERVGVHDNFFELGGHSLLVTQVISRARAACQVQLPLRSLFEAPTVAAMAERIEALRLIARRPAPLPAEAAGDREVGEI